jgi:beta-phosphoglucomutase-like phosphatase (HAD superfamily)
VAAVKLGLDPAACCVIEDSLIGLQAALGAGMRCIITYTPNTKSQVRVVVLVSRVTQGEGGTCCITAASRLGARVA